jgi:anaerobic dimethyl sulfoxide reductase subunit B (iron-sulfur subunit)
MGFYFDQDLCIGCGECELICQTEHNPDDSISWRKVITIEEGDMLANLSYSCYHCAEPLCLPVCPVGAITKRSEDGIVLVDSQICAEARKTSECTGTPCKDACPYDVPKFGQGGTAGMQKCNLCLDRLATGEKPFCVIMCPAEALDAAPLNELTARYGDGKEAVGFEYSNAAKPSVIFKSITN